MNFNHILPLSFNIELILQPKEQFKKKEEC